MQRIAMLVVVGSVISLVGCQDKNKNMEPDQSAQLDYGALQPELYATTAPSVSEPPAVTADYQTYNQPVKTYEAPQTSPPGSTHVVAKGDTLYQLARHYYDDASRWRTIYDANRDTLSSPNKLYVGQKLMIP